jgi:hypothetical protein
MENYFATFNFYDQKGRRLNIFAEQEGNDLKITVITCSRKDMFSKKKGRSLYEKWVTGENATEISPKVHIVPISDTKKSKKEFINWCRENFMRKRIIEIEATASVFLDKDGNVMEAELLKRIRNAMQNGI